MSCKSSTRSISHSAYLWAISAAASIFSLPVQCFCRFLAVFSHALRTCATQATKGGVILTEQWASVVQHGNESHRVAEQERTPRHAHHAHRRVRVDRDRFDHDYARPCAVQEINRARQAAKEGAPAPVALEAICGLRDVRSRQESGRGRRSSASAGPLLKCFWGSPGQMVRASGDGSAN